jgi:hypothetical protein
MIKKSFFGFIIIGLVILSSLSYAKGGSSGGSVTKEVVVEPAAPDCELFTALKERVKCRLEFGQEKETTPEPCRAIVGNDWCVALYKDSVPCYEKTGKEKGMCLKQVAKLEKVKGADKKAVRNYIVLLLYDLEERVEDAQKDGDITLDEGADLITEIVAIKELVLTNEPPGQIKKALADLKAAWPEALK